MNKILIATTNKGKQKEFALILKSFELIFLDTLPSILPPEETSETFEENAKIKAEAYWNHFKMPLIVEDSGFCVKALNGAPGVRSAEWGVNGDFTPAISKIYQLLEGGQSEASFVSVVLFKDGKREIFGKGSVEGKIAPFPSGTNGFGFDPCFIPKGSDKTFAEMTIEQKSLLSHRKMAINDLYSKL